MRARNLFIFVCIIVVLISCDKHMPFQDSRSDVRLNVELSVHEGTRAVVSGSNFPQNATMGLFICRHESGTPVLFEEYNPKYNNLQAIQTSSVVETPVWNYKYSGTSIQFSSLFLLKPQTGVLSADFYAYAPWTSGVTAPTQIPFNLSTTYQKLPDIMQATENNTAINKDKTPDGTPIDIHFHFVHKLAWLQCRFILKNDDVDGTLGPGSEDDSKNKCMLNSIVVRKKDGGSTPLFASGNFNAIDGTFSNDSGDGSPADADSLEVTYGYEFGTKGNTYNILLIPHNYLTDGDYELVFTMDGNTLETAYPIKVSDLLHSDGVTQGFKEGYRYVFTFTYDNYHHIHLKGTQVDTDADWTEFPEQKEIII